MHLAAPTQNASVRTEIVVSGAGALGGLMFAHATFIIFLVSEGVPLATIGLLQGLQSALMLALEVPTGILADRLRRHWMIALGRSLWGCRTSCSR